MAWLGSISHIHTLFSSGWIEMMIRKAEKTNLVLKKEKHKHLYPESYAYIYDRLLCIYKKAKEISFFSLIILDDYFFLLI